MFLFLTVIIFHVWEIVLTTIAIILGILAQCRIEGAQKGFDRQLQCVVKAVNVILLVKRVVHLHKSFSLCIV
jgi:hypothetical protein